MTVLPIAVSGCKFTKGFQSAVFEQLEFSSYAPIQVIETDEDTTVVEILANKTQQSANLRFEIVEVPTKGVINIVDELTGEIEYVPNQNTFGMDEFGFVVH